jgi:hypothetical protein
MVNLVDKQGYQKRLGDKFQEVLTNSPFKDSVELTWFDYHAQCKGMKVENCAKLINAIQESIQSQGWMEATWKEGTIKSEYNKKALEILPGDKMESSEQIVLIVWIEAMWSSLCLGDIICYPFLPKRN